MQELGDFEYEVKSIPVDENLLTTVSQLQADGWKMVEGIKPVAIYHLIRPKQRPVPAMGGGMGVLRIDESKVRILRKDGTLE